MPSIAYKVAIAKAFGPYPKDDEVEFIINVDLVSPDKFYVLDREAIEKLPDDPMDLFERGELDDHFKVNKRGFAESG